MLVFKLSMPNVGSWNGKWTGEERIYVKSRRDLTKKHTLYGKLKDNYFYDFGDGWGASVSVEEMPANEATKLMRKSQGFCGYEWMIDSILENNKIIA